MNDAQVQTVIKLDANDVADMRAKKLFAIMGLALNVVGFEMLGRASDVMATYQDLDTLAALTEEGKEDTGNVGTMSEQGPGASDFEGE